jgi:hypothetical protein
MPVVIAVCLALLWVFALRRWYRQAPTPLESVEHQQRTLDALQHAASRSRTPGPAPVPGRPLRNISVARAGRTQRSLLPLGIALAGTLVLGGLGAVWWLGRDTTHNQAASPTRRTEPPTTTTTAPATTTTTTTIPTVAQATVSRQSANGIELAVDRQTFTISVAATGRCWLRATDPNQTRSSLFEGILAAGDTRAIPVNGSAVLRLGAARNVTLTLDGQPLPLPGQIGNTLTLTFNGSTSGA